MCVSLPRPWFVRLPSAHADKFRTWVANFLLYTHLMKRFAMLPVRNAPALRTITPATRRRLALSRSLISPQIEPLMSQISTSSEHKMAHAF